MHILVINSGSSSIKFSIFESGAADPCSILDGEIAGFGTSDATLTIGNSDSNVDASTPEAAIHAVLESLRTAKAPDADAIGYRVVHPGAKLDRHQRITDEVLSELDEAAEFAPLHDPVVLKIIRAMRNRLPHIGHYACFDTVFHQTMPEEATTFPLPASVRERGVKRYGFHGLSCESIVRRMKKETHGFPKHAVIAHLGSGCSVTALVGGHSVDTSMGLTPDGGVVMGTRPGDLDPGLVLYLLRQNGGIDAVEKMLNHDAGMAALSERKNDVKALREAASAGDEKARLALAIFTRSVRKAVGGYSWLLGSLDTVIFSGGIGEHDPATRAEVLTGLEGLGISLGKDAQEKGMRRVSLATSATAVWVVPAEEDLMIAVHVKQMHGEAVSGSPSVPQNDKR